MEENNLKTYLLKHKEPNDSLILDYVQKNGGRCVYSSPILPIMGITITNELKEKIESYFELDYIMEDPVGRLQDVEGTVNSVQRNTNNLQIVPRIDFQSLTKDNLTGWGTTVAVLDSGIVNEKWVVEHHDFTAFGSTPFIDHGTKVASIIRLAAPGSKIISFKVSQDGYVSGTNVLKAIDLAVTKADIINMSIGFNSSVTKCTESNPCTFCEYVNYYTQNSDKLFVVAAGNRGEENKKENLVQCPGNSQEAITVGAIKPHVEQLADYSSPGVAGMKKPNILTSGTIYFNQMLDYGTSFSTPIITGVCATLFSKLQNSIPDTKSYLYSATIDIGLPEHQQGFGLFNLEKLLEVFINDQSNDQSEGQEQS
ncbi:S8 family peptidase [Peribacillus sp. NPDC097675]|uniref:S8 family peptidase n=1 Tax=Peribacillus sp. NPDC097675 TaxID=3390618 RepID=UPI003D03AFC6